MIGVFLLAFAVRGAFAAAQLPSLEADPDAYRQLAITWRTTGVFAVGPGEREDVRPTAYRPPLYPLVLAALVEHGAVAPERTASLHAVLGAATVALTLLLGYQAKLGAWSYLAAGLTLCDPILLHQSTVVMTETLATFLATVSLALLARLGQHGNLPASAASGGALGLAVLCRPTFLVWLALVVVAIVVQRGFPRRWGHALALALAAATVVAPWAIRNSLHFGRPIATTTHGGYTLWLGNNDPYYDYLLAGKETVFDAERLLPLLAEVNGQAPEGEIAMDRLLYEEAKQTIARRPAVFAYACLVRVGHLWRLTPRRVEESESTLRTLARLSVGVWYGGVYVLAALGIVSLGRRVLRSPWLWSVLLCLAFTAVHAVYWTDMRMRAPLAPAVSLAAAAGAAWFMRRSTNRQE